MKISVATSSKFFVEENAILQALFEEGLEELHMYKPDSEPIYCERLLTLMQPKWYKRIIANDHFYLKNEYNLKGIHISDRNPELPHNYKGFFSKSCTLENIDEWKNKCDYVVLDVNPTILHRAQMDNKINHKVYARGITTIEGLYEAQSSGFGGIILDNVLWNTFDFHDSSDYKELVEIFKKFRKAAD